jgi:molybdate transport system ATP-binding protein
MRGDRLHAKLFAHLGTFTLDLSLEVGVGVTTLFGPSGSGKTSTLRAISGLLALDAGTVRLNDASWDSLPPERREVGYVFQSSALFPHLTVEQNIAFGARSPQDTARWIQRLRLGDAAARKPVTLSGGEAQRVALARALARSPRVLLLDEPFSSLDTALRDELVAELKELVEAEQLVTLLVTHAREEAERLGGKFLHLVAGRIP